METINNIPCIRSIYQYSLYEDKSVRLKGRRMNIVILFKDSCEILPEYFYIEIFDKQYFMTKSSPLLSVVFSSPQEFISNPVVKFRHIISKYVFYTWQSEVIDISTDGLGTNAPATLTRFMTNSLGIIDTTVAYQGKGIPLERYLDVFMSFPDSILS